MASGGRAVRKLSPYPQRTEDSLSGTGRRLQYPSHHQVPVLADDGEEPERHLRLCQSGTGGLSAGDRAAVHLHRCGYRNRAEHYSRRVNGRDGCRVCRDKCTPLEGWT